MNIEKTRMHFTAKELLNPTNPITVNLIGAGGTGSKVLTCLLEMNHSLIELGHPGLFIRLWDSDKVTGANIGRQRFAQCEEGLYKSVALINRANRWAGTNWKSETQRFAKNNFGKLPANVKATLYISCVDSVKARLEITEILKELGEYRNYGDRPAYLLDFGNSKDTGQVILSTIAEIRQPKSEKFETVATLPFMTDEYGELLQQSEISDDTPSCSLAEALEKQDLYINSALAQMGCSLLWGLFRNGMTPYRGFFLNLKDFHSQPIPVE